MDADLRRWEKQFTFICEVGVNLRFPRSSFEDDEQVICARDVSARHPRPFSPEYRGEVRICKWMCG